MRCLVSSVSLVVCGSLLAPLRSSISCRNTILHFSNNSTVTIIQWSFAYKTHSLHHYHLPAVDKGITSSLVSTAPCIRSTHEHYYWVGVVEWNKYLIKVLRRDSITPVLCQFPRLCISVTFTCINYMYMHFLY